MIGAAVSLWRLRLCGGLAARERTVHMMLMISEEEKQNREQHKRIGCSPQHSYERFLLSTSVYNNRASYG